MRQPLEDDLRASLFERLKSYSISSGFRYREIALDGTWWKDEGPPFMAIDGETVRVVPRATSQQIDRYKAHAPRTPKAVNPHA